ncbi:hypothetical protein [Kitasatospora sp. NPDC088351]|uniref:hypothetical protein n=1 Tax=Kitasatospora sp. NPDC088351 TaxID=3155180 RepID=UPI00344954AF
MMWPDALVETAKQITVPIEFAMPWDNERIPREAGLALFDAFASKERTSHANTGQHFDMPRFEADSAARFLARHLGRTVTSPARGERQRRPVRRSGAATAARESFGQVVSWSSRPTATRTSASWTSSGPVLR